MDESKQCEEHQHQTALVNVNDPMLEEDDAMLQSESTATGEVSKYMRSAEGASQIPHSSLLLPLPSPPPPQQLLHVDRAMSSLMKLQEEEEEFGEEELERTDAARLKEMKYSEIHDRASILALLMDDSEYADHKQIASERSNNREAIEEGQTEVNSSSSRLNYWSADNGEVEKNFSNGNGEEGKRKRAKKGSRQSAKTTKGSHRKVLSTDEKESGLKRARGEDSMRRSRKEVPEDRSSHTESKKLDRTAKHTAITKHMGVSAADSDSDYIDSHKGSIGREDDCESLEVIDEDSSEVVDLT
jgi:hypothetical protein